MSINLGKKLTGLAVFFAMSASCALAASDLNTLSEVQINATDSGYSVVLKTDSSAQMKKVVSSPDKMFIELKNVQAAENLNTVYNNVANIDNVTIQPSSKDNLKITLQGENISSSKVYFEEVSTLPVANPENSESIELSGPVTSYRPVYHPSHEEIDQTANPRLNSALTAMNIDRKTVVSTKHFVKKGLNKAKDNNMLVAFGILILAATFILKPKKQAKNNLQIGLSQSVKNPQIEREIALSQKLSAPASNINTISSSPAANYGMKAYQQSLKNPYMTSNAAPTKAGISGIPRKPAAARRPAPAIQKPAMQAAPAPKMPSMMQNTIQSQAPSFAANQTKAANIDSVRFLESITKIYEKNGRNDLAKGLKDNLRKAQATGV